MRKTLAAGLGAAAAVSMALLLPAGTGAAQTAPPTTTTTSPATIIDALCQRLPGLQSVVEEGIGDDAEELAVARDTVAKRRATMGTALAELATAVVNHLSALDAGGNTGATGSILKGKQAAYVQAVVAWSEARTAAFDQEKQVTQGELQRSLLAAVGADACG